MSALHFMHLERTLQIFLIYILHSLDQGSWAFDCPRNRPDPSVITVREIVHCS